MIFHFSEENKLLVILYINTFPATITSLIFETTFPSQIYEFQAFKKNSGISSGKGDNYVFVIGLNNLIITMLFSGPSMDVMLIKRVFRRVNFILQSREDHSTMKNCAHCLRGAKTGHDFT